MVILVNGLRVKTLTSLAPWQHLQFLDMLQEAPVAMGLRSV